MKQRIGKISPQGDIYTRIHPASERTDNIRMDQTEIDQMSLLERAAAPTPRFFNVLKTIGITLAAVSGALLTAPVALPAIVTTIAAYLAVAGTVATAVSQAAVES